MFSAFFSKLGEIIYINILLKRFLNKEFFTIDSGLVFSRWSSMTILNFINYCSLGLYTFQILGMCKAMRILRPLLVHCCHYLLSWTVFLSHCAIQDFSILQWSKPNRVIPRCRLKWMGKGIPTETLTRVLCWWPAKFICFGLIKAKLSAYFTPQVLKLLQAVSIPNYQIYFLDSTSIQGLAHMPRLHLL